jgi:polysaccharide deacetylase family protein (PEP-CTERM system associated)
MNLPSWISGPGIPKDRELNPYRNVFSVDVEEYFQVEAFSDFIKKADWDNYPRRAEEQTKRTLDLLDTFQVRATFFVLGWVAERNSDLIRKIHDAGHEIASHGFAHKMISGMSPREFQLDIRRSKDILEGITKNEIHGYRAPTFSIVEKTAWAYEILLEEGYRYSSSVFPIWHDRYGWPGFGHVPRRMAANGKGEIWEIPMAVGTIGPFRIPFGGGGYLRLYPLFLTKALFRSLEKKGKGAMMYIHPWELDTAHPPVQAPLSRRLRHYLGIRHMEGKLVALLQSLKFDTVSQVLETVKKADKGLPSR